MKLINTPKIAAKEEYTPECNGNSGCDINCGCETSCLILCYCVYI